MKRLTTLLLITSFLLALACTDKPGYEKLVDGIVVYPSGASGNVKQIRLRAISENIIQVNAAASDSFSSTKSLMVVPQPEYTSFTVSEEKGKVTMATPRLRVEVSGETGEVIFKDSLGNILLQEQKGGGKNFTLTKVDDQQAYQIRQIFESPDDEAFYGLGGHQNGQMNYKGEDVELVQHNIVDVVPFVYSSKNYGLLWDNYSISHFGDPREYQPLSTLELFDKNGIAGGLTADYYVNDKVVKSSTEDRIGYEFLETPEVDQFPKDIAQKGKVIWQGSFTSQVEGAHKFLVYASGYFKVWVDGKLLMDKWRQNWNPWTNKFNVDIRKGEKHEIKIEWIPEGGFMSVKHLDPLPENEQSKLSLSSEIADEINYYFIAGENADSVISGYRTLTGKSPIVPKWAMGFWQSRERYKNQQEIVDVVKEYRKRNIPLDNIVLDWQYWEDPQWGSHEFDRSRFPDPKGMLSALHDQLHANLMISVWPKFNKGTQHYDEMYKNGFLFTRNIQKQRKDWVGVGYESTFYDPFNPEAGKMFWNQIDTKLNRIGIDAWWLDATEPDMHSNLSIEERKLNMSPTAMGPGAKYFNAYSLLNSKSVYEGQRKSSPDKRVFILTRSSYGGQQRYGAATWSGDIVSRWSDMQDQIATGINFSLSGIPYWTMDIGGFAVESRYYNAKGETLNEWRELNTRWFQFGAFCPLFRSHGQFPFREIYNIAPEGHEAYKSMVYYDKLRYRLMPYIYSLSGYTYLNDYTIMRGLIMDFPHDANVKNIGDQYMFGPSLLVNPVYEYKARSREVYLPSGGGWYNLYSGQYMKGGSKITAGAPLDKIPVYVKEGSILPVGPEMQYTGEKPTDPITLYIYTGKDATFSLYEDEGLNYNYERGEYTLIPLHYDHASRTLTIGDRKGAYKNMLVNRKFAVVWVTTDNAAGLDTPVQPSQLVDYNGQQTTITMQ
jgi:alpha-D-xyloside xylohydrolase